VASERQIAANRRNALKSTGPKSETGKKRSARNALRYGFSVVSVHSPCEAVESLARHMVGDLASEKALAYAREAARAQLELDRTRALKAEIINRTYLFGTLEPRPLPFRSTAAEIRYIKQQPFDQPLRWPRQINPSDVMPSEEGARMAAALEKTLPAFRTLNRYESRVIRRRDNALHQVSEILASSIAKTEKPRSMQEAIFAKRSQFS
jgi:hypothetical protein